MKNNRLKKISIYVLGTLTGIGLSLSMQTIAAKEESNPLPVKEIRTLAEVYGQIKANYYKDTKDDELIRNAIKGMVGKLDPHSEYMNIKDFKELQEGTKGEFGGLGIEIGKEDDFVKVISPIEDTPADKAGVKSGDLIIKIEDKSTRGMALTDAVKRMRGKPGTPIKITILRQESGKPVELSITRAIIKVQSVRSHLLENGYAYLRVSQFQERTLDDLASNITKIRQQNKAPFKGIILDLRNDPGGLLNMAVGVSAVFLPENQVVVSTKDRNNKETMSLKSVRSDYLPGRVGKNPLEDLPKEIKSIPLVVLMNSGSASASEIVGGALQDYQRAVILGTQSFGKGSVQTVIPLSDGGGVKLTTALYYTPKDRSIQAHGIVPDVEVKDGITTMEFREADLGGHLSNPNGDKEIKGKVIKREKSADDSVKKDDKDAVEERDNQKENQSKEKEQSNQKKDDKKKSNQKDKIEESRIPNPEKDKQLKAALDLLKDSTKWQQSLGLAAKKKNNKNADDQDKEE